jgi:hypothetical protein
MIGTTTPPGSVPVAGRAFNEDSEDSVEKRPKNREVENEMVKAPLAEGEPPTPATEPDSPPKQRY